ncbi:helix-turn-helix transcriptional regulator [Haemophilus influenzae]|nr:helix-turn-helix transcriptional regulator [Haemophilus influenzae]OOD26217.1 transcriptional regulator [Haemophilus influenzae]PKF66174.1 XRE family transcriptional regulator [Haemophilus influenzae]POR98959.1 XRE family transcriptional regulator [Haemophilus influenzae]TWV00894.1 helix-turn-helix transcriptional regulator [Haemophilus influenzae]
MGVTGNLRLSVHSAEHTWLRKLFIQRRNDLGLLQRALGKKMGVLASFIGKVETGDRRLDILEFIQYCKGLELDPVQILDDIEKRFYSTLETRKHI